MNDITPISSITIHKVDNGYIISFYASEKVFLNLEDVFNELLLYFEGKGSTFLDSLYGKVIIERIKNND